MTKSTCKNPSGEPTRKQTFCVFCMTGTDIREAKLTRQEVSNMIGELKLKGDYTLPTGKTLPDGSDFIATKVALRETANKLWEKSGMTNPMSVKAVVKSKKNKSSWAEELVAKASKAGELAMKELIDSNKVAPMIVQQHADVADDNSAVVEKWVVPGGPCGFASIRVKCTNGVSRKFINQLKKMGLAGPRNSHTEWSKSDYYGGYMKSFSLVGGQSLAFKEAYAYAYEGVLAEAGINTWVWTRMD